MAWAVARLEVVEVLPGSGRRQRCVDVGPAGLAAKLLARRRRKEPDSSTQAAAATGVGASAASRPPRYPSTPHFAVLRRWSHPDLELASAAPSCPPPAHPPQPIPCFRPQTCSRRYGVSLVSSHGGGLDRKPVLWVAQSPPPSTCLSTIHRPRSLWWVSSSSVHTTTYPLRVPRPSTLVFCPPSFMIGRSVDLDL